MAVIRHSDGRDEIVRSEVAEQVWLILNNEVEATKDQAEYCSTVERVFLNWHTAPDSYVQRHIGEIKRMVIQEWMRDRDGDYLRPEPSDADNIAFSKKWKLWSGSRSTEATAISNSMNTHYSSK